MTEFLSHLTSGPVVLALIPLALALAVFVAERLGLGGPEVLEGPSRCRCDDGSAH